MLECVVNVSEGRRADVLAELAEACAPVLLDLHADPDHHRSVFTLGGAESEVAEGALGLLRAASRRIDVSGHEGVHPRLGAVDVVPFVALGSTLPSAAVAAALSFAEVAASEVGVPVFLYDDADRAGRTLPEARREAFRTRAPDLGPPAPHPSLGAVAVGARPAMVAVNCELTSDDLGVARAVARALRERDGGLPGVRALAFPLASRARAQVSMNLVRLAATGLEAACTAVRREAEARGAGVAAVELVGLIPEAELHRCSEDFVAWSGVGPDQTIEARLRAAGK